MCVYNIISLVALYVLLESRVKGPENNIGLCWVIQLWPSPKEQWINKVKLTQFSWAIYIL